MPPPSGLSVQEILDMVSAALGGKVVSQVIEGDKNFALQVSFPYDFRREPEKIANIPIVLPTGGVIPLSRVAHIRYDTGASFIYRENHKRYIPIKFSVTSKDLGGTVQKAQKEAAKIKLPEGYYLEWSGIFNEMKEAFPEILHLHPSGHFPHPHPPLHLLRKYEKCAPDHRCPDLYRIRGTRQPVDTRSSLSVSRPSSDSSPSSGFPSSTPASGSPITSRSTGRRKDKEKATLETVRDKFRPVLMGGLIASLGLFPASMAHGVGSQVQKPLAIVIVGGMLIGTVIILLVMPLLFRFVRVEKK